MHEAALSRAVSPDLAIIRGLPLKKYSLGHEILLARDNNPLVCNGKVEEHDLLDALWICSNSWVENQNRHEQWSEPIKRYLWERWNPWRWCQSVEAAIKLFHQYRETALQMFPISDLPRPDGATPTRLPGAPFLLRLQQWLMLTFRLTEEQAWDYQLGFAVMRWQTYWEQEQAISIYGPQDESLKAFKDDPKTQEALKELKRKAKCRV